MAKNDTARRTDDSFPASTSVGNNAGSFGTTGDEVTEVRDETVFTTTDTIPAGELRDIDLDASADDDMLDSAAAEPMMSETRGGGEAVPPSLVGDVDTVPTMTTGSVASGAYGDALATGGANGAATPANDLKQKAADAVDSAKGAAAGALDTAKQKAGEVVGQAKDQVVSQLNDQKVRAADGLGSLTTALRQTGDVLQQNGLPAPVADYANSFAGQVERFASYLRDKDVDDLARDAGDYARKNPMVFVGGAFLLGLAVARFLKSSESKAEELRANAASRNNFGTASRGALVPVEGTYRGDLSSRTEEGHTSQFSEDALPDNRPMTAHGYVPGIGVTHTDSPSPNSGTV
jgi:hypothetical protein